MGKGAKLSHASDAWAFGALSFFVYAGRPPTLGLDDSETLQKVVGFSVSPELYPPEMPSAAKDLCDALLVPVGGRAELKTLQNQCLFAGLSIHELCEAIPPPLASGIVRAATADSHYHRRQNSMLISAPPSEFAFDSLVSCDGPIAEGDETNAPWSFIDASGQRADRGSRKRSLGN